MPAMDTVLFNDPEVKGLALAILEECVDLREFGRRMLELVANAAMSARADEECGAAYGERSPERTNSRNGYRERGLATSVGDVTLRIPKLRSGSFFPDDLIERYCRVDRALVAAVAEMHVMGGVHAQGGGRRRRARRVVDVEVAGVALVRGPRRRGRRVPPPALRRRALRVPLARRNLREVPRGGPLGVPGGRDRHRARRHGPQALPGRGLRRHGEPRGLEGVPVRPARTRRRGREARRLGRARGAQGGGGRDLPGRRLAALRDAPHAQRGGAHLQEGGPAPRPRGHEGRLRPEEPDPGEGVLPAGDRGDPEALQGRRRGPARWPTWRSRRRTGSGSAPTTSRRGPTARSSAAPTSCRGSPRASR